ncbi:MAG: SRPBCC family protein [Wenzhouxiangellaceae bacterium]
MNSNSARTLARDSAFILERTLPATPGAVWRALTEPERLNCWWGPKGMPPCHCNLDLRDGGSFHYGLQMPDGGVMWGRWDIESVEPEHRLAFLSMFSDENGGGPTRHPWEPDWPLLMWTEIGFGPAREGTRLAITWIPVDATVGEIRRFERGHEECRVGWTGTLDQLEDFLMQEERST